MGVRELLGACEVQAAGTALSEWVLAEPVGVGDLADPLLGVAPSANLLDPEQFVAVAGLDDPRKNPEHPGDGEQGDQEQQQEQCLAEEERHRENEACEEEEDDSEHATNGRTSRVVGAVEEHERIAGAAFELPLAQPPGEPSSVDIDAAAVQSRDEHQSPEIPSPSPACSSKFSCSSRCSTGTPSLRRAREVQSRWKNSLTTWGRVRMIASRASTSATLAASPSIGSTVSRSPTA